MKNYLISSIYLADVLLYKHNFSVIPDSQESTPSYKPLHSLSKVNILIGPNNSGKSRFLRSLSSIDRYQFSPTDLNLKEWNQFQQDFINQIKSMIRSMGIRDYDNIISTIEQYRISTIPYINERENLLEKFNKITEKIKNLSGIPSVSFQTGGGLDKNRHIILQQNLKEYLKTQEDSFNKQFSNLNKKPSYSFKKVYISVLRGFRIFQSESSNSDMYENKIRSDHFDFGSNNNEGLVNPKIFTGYTLYDKLQKMLLGEKTQRDLVKEFEKFIGNHFFNGEEFQLIPRIEDRHKDVYIKIGGEKERPIYELGDGIQQLIIHLFPAFENRNNNLILFIEEPELYLHAGMQRQFLDTILNEEKFKNVQLFVTTHSNHFLDLTLDYEQISIFKFQKDFQNNNCIIQNVDNADESILRELGIRNSSIFLSNCTVWVEGITDRLLIRHYVNLYQKTLSLEKQFKEDLHYSFVEYGGGNITHWSFLDEEAGINVNRLCGKLLLITDKDSEDKKVERKEKLKKVLDDRYKCLKCRELENLISKDVLIKIIADYEKEDPDKVNNNFSEPDYKDRCLGRFIERDVLKGNISRHGGYYEKKNNPKTKENKDTDQDYAAPIKNKNSFIEKAIAYTKTFDDLSDEAKKLTESIYKFIQQNNS